MLPRIVKPIAVAFAGVALPLLWAVIASAAPEAPKEQTPVPAPSRERPINEDEHSQGRSGGSPGEADPHERPPRGKPSGGEDVDPDEWVELEKFMQVHSPSKWQMYDSLPDRALKQTLKKQITQRYRTLQRVEKTDPIRWKLEIEAIGIEDEIYRILQELRLGNDLEAHEQRLRIQVDRLVANRDNWRRERLLRVKAELESLKLKDSIGPVDAEIERLKSTTPESRAPRVDKRIEEFKRYTEKPPRALLGGRSPASQVPAASVQD